MYVICFTRKNSLPPIDYPPARIRLSTGDAEEGQELRGDLELHGSELAANPYALAAFYVGRR